MRSAPHGTDRRAALCLDLLVDGVAVQPGQLDGLPSSGALVVSLLPEADVFQAGPERLERHLRRGE